MCSVAAIRLTIVNGVSGGEAESSAKSTPSRVDTSMVPESQPSDGDVENEGEGSADVLLPIEDTSSEDDDDEAVILKQDEHGNYYRTKRGPGRSPSPPKSTPKVCKNLTRLFVSGVMDLI